MLNKKVISIVLGTMCFALTCRNMCANKDCKGI